MKKELFVLVMLFITFDSFSQKGMDIFTKGVLKSEKGDFKGAIVDFTRAIEIEEESNKEVLGLYYVNRANSKRKMEDFRGSVSDFTRAIELIDSKEVDLLHDTYNLRGVSKLSLKDYPGAITDFSKAIQLGDPDGESSFYRGLPKIKINQKESGCFVFSRVGELGFPQAYEAISRYCK
jgi:tetratricopeptide (TPR) repeat protein